jgi:hypothetical protein
VLVVSAVMMLVLTSKTAEKVTRGTGVTSLRCTNTGRGEEARREGQSGDGEEEKEGRPGCALHVRLVSAVMWNLLEQCQDCLLGVCAVLALVGDTDRHRGM